MIVPSAPAWMFRGAMQRRALSILSAGTVCLALAACSSWPDAAHPVPAGRPLRVAVLPVRCTVDINKLDSIQTLPKGAARPADSAERIRALVGQAEEEITASLKTALGANGRFEVVPADGGAGVSEERHEADAVLEVQLSGYGKIKKKWQVLLVASGMGEALVQGIAAYKVSDNRWVGIGWAAEETAQELLTWVGGVALFNRLFTPVILEARLTGPAGGEPLWTKTIIATGRKKDFKTLPEDERKRKEVRLRVVREKAVKSLVNALAKRLGPAR